MTALQRLDSQIEAVRLAFYKLNREHWRQPGHRGKYQALSISDERAVIELAEEIARLQMTKSVIASGLMNA